MKIEIFLLAMILISSIAFSLSVEKIFSDDIQAMCENDSNGQLICLTADNYEKDIPIIYTEDVECLTNSSTFNPDNAITCYSKVKPLKIERFTLTYKKKASPEEMAKTYDYLTTVKKTKTYFPNQEINVVVNPYLLNNTKCTEEKNASMPPDYYYFKCDFKNKKQKADILIGEKAFIIMDARQGFSINTEEIIYIILGLVIIAIIYSIIKKPNKKKRRK